MTREIPAWMDNATVATIDARLETIRRENGVAIPLAIESGSRAWGFPSPDSDYDCRFIFLRRREDYLSLYPMRDVIETPLEGLLDLNGWDLAKALRLLLKGNAVVVEWLTSPIIYAGNDWFRTEFQALAMRRLDRDLVAHHYLHLGERQRHAYFEDGKQFKLKKLFYALRPAMALRWLRLHAGEAVAPMHFPTLLASCDVPPPIVRLADGLIEKKASTRELGTGEIPEAIAAFIDDEFEAAKAFFNTPARSPTSDAVADAQRFFLATVEQWDELQAS